MNREAWLNAVVRAMRPRFRAAGYELPREIRVSCGFPDSDAWGVGRSQRHRTDAVCFPPYCTADGVPQIFVTPILAESLAVASTLAHEVLHTAKLKGDDTHLYSHGAAFQAGMQAIGLAGEAYRSHSGPELRAFLRDAIERIGPYPHARILPAGRKPARG